MSAPTPRATGRPGPRAVPPVRLVVAGLILAAVTAGVSAAFVPSLAVAYGLPAAGIVVTFGLPAARMVALGAAAAGIGQLLTAAVLIPGDPDGVVSDDGYRGLRATRLCALIEAAAGMVVAVLTVVENTGLGTERLLGSLPALLTGLTQIAPAAGWMFTSALALLLAAVADWVLSWRGAVGLLLVGLVTPLPAMLTAVTTAQRSHDIAGDALALHVLGALMWMGSTSAVAVLLARRGQPSALLLRRHGVVASWSLVVVGASGVISSAYAVSAADLFSSGFGWLVVASVAALVALALIGRRVRGMAAGVDSRRDRPLARVAALITVELVLLAGAAAVGTGLTRVVPPAQQAYVTSRSVYSIGYDLPTTFSLLELASRWRIDLVFASLATIAAVGYLFGVRRAGRAGEMWPRHRTAFWLAGCATLLVATSSGIGLYSTAMFSVHMVQHMLLATLIPVLLVLGHPVTLAIRALAPRTARRLLELLDSPVVGFLSHPLVAWTTVGLTLFGLYTTGFYEALLQQHWAHLVMNAAFLGTGLALFRSILGSSLGRRELPPIGQLVMIFAVMGLHAVFAAWLLSRSAPLAAQFYGPLRLPYVPDLLADQRRGAVLSWMLGELPVILAVVSLVVRWTRADDDEAEEQAWRITEPAHAGLR